MKKIPVILGALFLLWALPAFAQSGPRAVLRELSGSVEVKGSGAAEWAPASAGMELSMDSHISTGFRSTAVLALGNSTLTVQPLTRLTIQEIADAGGDERISLHLRSGRVRAEVNPPTGGKADFTVRSPAATASVRGTQFDFDTLTLRVHSGVVGFTGTADRMVYVRQGEGSRIDAEGQSALPYLVAMEELLPSAPVNSTLAQSGSQVKEFPGTGLGSIDISAGWYNPNPGGKGNMNIGVGWYSPGRNPGAAGGMNAGVGWYSPPGGSSGEKAGLEISW
jgi:hypothetical protein